MVLLLSISKIAALDTVKVMEIITIGGHDNT